MAPTEARKMKRQIDKRKQRQKNKDKQREPGNRNAETEKQVKHRKKHGGKT